MRSAVFLGCLAWALPALAGGQNLLQNPGFEEAIDFAFNAGWDGRGPSALGRVAAPARSGTRALHSRDRDQALGNGARRVAATGSEVAADHRASVWARTPDHLPEDASDEVVPRLMAKQSDGAPAYENFAKATASEGAWTQPEDARRFDRADAQAIGLSVRGPATGKDFFVDDAALERMPDEPSPDGGDASSVEARDFAFRSRGEAGEAGLWQLDAPGYIGSFVRVDGDATQRVAFSVEAANEGGGEVIAEVNVGGYRWTVSTGRSRATHTRILDLPPGLHTVRVSFANPRLDGSATLQLYGASVEGAKVRFDNRPTAERALEAARTYIEHFRQGSKRIELRDGDGDLLPPGTPVTVRLERHAATFGVAVAGSKWNYPAWFDSTHPDYASMSPYRDFIVDNFNAIVPANGGKWTSQEPSRDAVKLARSDLIQNWAARNDLDMRMHALAWPREDGAGDPDWIRRLREDALAGDAAAAEDVRAELSERLDWYTEGRARRWLEMDVINEGVHRTDYVDLYGYDGLAGIYEASIDRLAALGAPTKVFTNDFNAFKTWPLNGDSSGFANGYLDHAFEIKARLPESKRDRLGIGAQHYVQFNPAKPQADYNPLRVYQVLQNLASLGGPVSVTEFAIKNGDPDSGIEAPTDAMEVEALRRSLLLALGNDRLNTFVFWQHYFPHMWDKANAAPMQNADFSVTNFGRAWQSIMGTADPRGDLFNDLPDLHTEYTARVDESGRIELAGFFGDYRLETEGRTYKATLEPRKPDPAPKNALVISVDDLKPLIGAYGDPIARTPDGSFRFGGLVGPNDLE